MTYGKYLQKRATPPTKPIPGRESEMKQNYAGGVTFKVDPWMQFRRFLILGTVGGNFYVGEQKLTEDHMPVLLHCVNEDGPKAVGMIREILAKGLAKKRDAVLFALALCAGADERGTRELALTAATQCIQIPTDLFGFLEECKHTRGRGSGLKRAVQNWYNDRPLGRLAYQVVKYRERKGWSHADVFNLFRPNPEDGAESKYAGGDEETRIQIETEIRDRKALYRWIARRKMDGDVEAPSIPIVDGYLQAQEATQEADWARLVREYRLTREMLPTEALRSPVVWEAMLESMPMTAMVRNLGNMSKIGLLTQGSNAATKVVEQLCNEKVLRKSKIHPMALLFALKTYGHGCGLKGKGTWSPVPVVMDALDQAFYTSFGNVEPTNKRIMVGLDISASMDWHPIDNSCVSPREAATALSLVNMATEKYCGVGGFSTSWTWLDISARRRMDDVISYVSALPMGGTNASLPITEALKGEIKVDAFLIYTDSQNWVGGQHVTQALERYREKMGIDAKLLCISMLSNGNTLADPKDPRQMDIVGFDPGTPSIISSFINGEL